MNQIETKLIIAFTKDWNDVPTCTTHILREMGRTMPVLWVNSIGMRRPQLSQSRDFRRILRKLAGAFRKAEWKENNLWVLSPLTLPKADSAFMKWLNRVSLKWAVKRALRPMGKGSIELWAFIPNAVDYLDAFGESKVVYYGVDDWSKYPGIDHEWVLTCERKLLERADVVFVSSRYLEERARTIAGARVNYMPHGVWFDKFSAAAVGQCEIPADILCLPSPRIGFYGNIHDWIDFKLLDELAVARPHWSFIMIGPVYCDVAGLAARKNICFLGRREAGQLPSYCRGFDVALIPYSLSDPRMESVNPVKLREMLAAGVPVVTTGIPEVRGISHYVKTARTTEEFLKALDESLAARYDRKAISDERRVDDWPLRVQQIRNTVDRSFRDVQ